jgi:hypothetical protein
MKLCSAQIQMLATTGSIQTEGVPAREQNGKDGSTVTPCQIRLSGFFITNNYKRWQVYSLKM